MDAFIVDEVPMLRPKVLDSLDELVCPLRGFDASLGGIHLILNGDFLQLPPVRHWAYFYNNMLATALSRTRTNAAAAGCSQTNQGPENITRF